MGSGGLDKLDHRMRPILRAIRPSVDYLGGNGTATLSTTTVFGTARQMTLSELAIEAFYQADQGTWDLLVR